MDLKKILPHNPPMILIDDVIGIDLANKTLFSEFCVTDDKLFFDKTIGGISSVVGIEFMAQTVGCYAFFNKKLEEPEIGFLLGTRHYESFIDCFEEGLKYSVKVVEIFSEDEIVVFDCVIYHNDKVCAKATINTYGAKNE